MNSLYSTFIAFSLLILQPLMANDATGPVPAHHAPHTIRAPDAPGPIFPPEDFLNLPETGKNDRFFTEFLNMLATLGLLIGIILIAAWFLKRFLNTRMEQINTTSSIKILERRALSPKTALYLLEVNDKSILIAESQNGVSLINSFDSEFPSSEQIPSKPASTSPFSAILKDKEKTH